MMTEQERERVRFTAYTWFDEGWKSVMRRVVRLLLIGGLIFLLWRSETIVTTLIISGVLGCAAGTLVDWICRLPSLRRFSAHSRRASVAGLVVVLILAGFFGAISLFFKPFQNEFAQLQQNLPAVQQKITDQIVHWQAWYDNEAPGWLHDAVEKQRAASDSGKGGGEDIASSVTKWATGVLGKTFSLAGHVVELILVPILAFYFIVDGKTLKKEFLRFVSVRRRRSVIAVLHESGHIMRSYLVAQFWLAVIAGVVVAVMLTAIRMDYVLVLAVLAAVTRAIPVIGPLLGGIPLGILVFIKCSETGNYFLLGLVLTIFTLTHLLESKLITPMFLGRSLNMHPVIIIVALLIGGEFFGLLGMFLAAPVTALIRAVLLHLYVHPFAKRAPRTELDRRVSHRHGHGHGGAPHVTPRLRRALNVVPRAEPHHNHERIG